MYATYQTGSVQHVQSPPSVAPARGVSLDDFATALAAGAGAPARVRRRVKRLPGYALVSFDDGRTERVSFVGTLPLDGSTVIVRREFRRRGAARARRTTVYSLAD